MEAKINIADILKNKPQGTKLYSLTYGGCFYQEYTGDFGIECQSQNGVQFNLDEYGRYCIDGECIVFPSKEMRDWHKFAWKKGDILVNGDKDVHIIFEAFENDTYTRFKGKHYLWKEGDEEDYCKEETFMLTSVFEKANDDAVKCYINTIEKRLGGKLNRETLEVEKQYEFKNGDIAFADYGNRQYVFIVSGKTNLLEGYNSFISLDLSSLTLSMGYITNFFKKDLCKLRLATEEEKKQLFPALEKEGKRWDSEKKEVVDLKPKCEFKPFDKVLVRDSESDKWCANLFGYIDKDEYYHCVYANWVYCIPYEGNEHLLGTTKDVEG